MSDSAREKMTSGGIWKADITATVGPLSATTSLCSPKEEMAKSALPSVTLSMAGSPGPPSRISTLRPSSS